LNTFSSLFIYAGFLQKQRKTLSDELLAGCLSDVSEVKHYKKKIGIMQSEATAKS